MHQFFIFFNQDICGPLAFLHLVNLIMNKMNIKGLFILRKSVG